MKKILYSLLSFFVLLIVLVVIAANSSWVIKKVADKFAPAYKISYDDITGNVFTGVNISGLRFDGKSMIKNVKFAWNPSKILYKRVSINELKVEEVNVDVIKALIASFPKSEDNSTSEPFSLVVLVDDVYLSINAFEEQKILIAKTVLEVEDLKYASDTLNIDYLSLHVDTNISNILLEASLDNGELEIAKLMVDDVDTVSLERMFLAKDTNASSTEGEHKSDNSVDEPLNPLVPKSVVLKEFKLSLNARAYKTAELEKFEFSISQLKADIVKVLNNEKDALNIENYALTLATNMGNVDVSGNIEEETVTLNHIYLKEIDALSLKSLLPADTNETNSTKQEVEIETEEKEINQLIPKFLVIKTLETTLVPTKYDPVNLQKLTLNVDDVKVDIAKLLVEKAAIKLNVLTNLSNISQSGKIQDNYFKGNIKLTPNRELFDLYALPLRKEAIGDIVIDLHASEKEVIAEVRAKAKHVLLMKKLESNVSDANDTQAFNIDIDDLLSHVVYNIKTNSINAETKIMLTTPYAENISITNQFMMDKNISYSGEIKAKEIIGVDAKFTQAVKNLLIRYKGNTKGANIDIDSDGLKGNFDSADFTKGLFHLETTKSIVLRDMVTLPAELNSTHVNAIVDVPLDFAAITPLNAKVKVLSNVSNLDIDVNYGKAIEVKVTSILPEDSLLKRFDENVKWNAITPMVVNAKLYEKDVDVSLSSKAIQSKVKYVLESGKVDGTLKLGGLVSNIQGSTQEKMLINTNVSSIKSLLDSVKSIYTLESLPPVEGVLNLSLNVTKMKEVDLILSSPKIIYRADRKTENIVNDIKVVVNANASQVLLKSYQVTYDKMKFFATKPSKVSLDDSTVLISPIWLNDSLQVLGEFDLKTQKGTINALADKLHFSHEIIDLDSKIAINTVLNAGETAIKGDVTLLGGKIKYDMSQKSFASDSDIIIVQDIKEESDSAFMKGLSLNVHVKTKKPLVYKKDAVNVKAKVDLSIQKVKMGEPMVLGSVEILKGGTYIFENKKFVIDKSFIYLVGNPNKPILDISINYKALNHLITIGVTGTPEIPNINFSSKPSLTREQILSVILFDSEGGAGTNSGDEMMKMMGGAMAKSVLSNMGVQLDHLVLGTDGSVEVGKKITDKIMFIYTNGELPQVKVKYSHNSRWESVISADEESESYDIVYKKDFSSDDISFSR